MFSYVADKGLELHFPVSLPGMNYSAHSYEVHLHAGEPATAPDCWVLSIVKLANPLFQDAGHDISPIPRIHVKEKKEDNLTSVEPVEERQHKRECQEKMQFPCSLAIQWLINC